MRILLSAFACSPIMGSEPGVGWNWLRVISQSHHVTLITHKYFEASIKLALGDLLPGRVNIIYVELKPLYGKFRMEHLNSRVYYYRWQYVAYLRAKKLLQHEVFDLVHHVTWGGIRFPSFLYRLGLPFYLGPVGGAETPTLRLIATLPVKEMGVELLRLMLLSLHRLDPILRSSLKAARLIVCKTVETRDFLPRCVQNRAPIALEIGCPDMPNPNTNFSTPDELRVMFAGRLVGLKGVHLAIDAVQRVASTGRNLSLTIVGEGPLISWLTARAQRAGLSKQVIFTGKMPKVDLLNRYSEADCFLFPSFHDSSGNVVVESLSRGLPVICLGLGGPASIVDETCGFVIPARKRTVDQIVQGMADALIVLHDDRKKLAELSVNAKHKAGLMTWEEQVGQVYRLIEADLAGVPASVSQHA